MRILIVDTHSRWGNYLKKTLESEGYEAEIVDFKDKNIEKNPKHNFDFIICDFKTFKKDLQIFTQLQIHDSTIRIIAAAELPKHNDAMYAKRHGADYIEKRFEHNEIIDIIDENITKTPLKKIYLKRRLKKENATEKNGNLIGG